MALCNQTSQRLLITLIRTARYYKTRPTLLASNHDRNHPGIATNARPPPYGFSVTFADGPLHGIIAKPTVITAEEPSASMGVITALGNTKAQEANLELVSAEQNGTDASAPDLFADAQIAPLKNEKPKKTLKKTKGKRVRAEDADQGRRRASGPGQSAWHETEKPEIEEIIKENEHLQKDYPDTRTIDEADRPSRAKHSTFAGKEEATEPPAKSQRPLSTYKETWQVQKAVLRSKFTEGWNPRKKLSPDTMEGIRALHAQYPDQYTTPVLAEQFAVSPEAIRRILKSKWSSNLEPEKATEKRERWAKRHDRIWDIKSEIGLRPQRKDVKEVEDPEQFVEELRGRQLLEAYRNA